MRVPRYRPVSRIAIAVAIFRASVYCCLTDYVRRNDTMMRRS